MDTIPYDILYTIIGYSDITMLQASHCVSKSFRDHSIPHRKNILISFLRDVYYNYIRLKYPDHPLSVLLLTYIYNSSNLYIPFYARYTAFVIDIENLIIQKKTSIIDIYRDYSIPRPTGKIKH